MGCFRLYSWCTGRPLVGFTCGAALALLVCLRIQIPECGRAWPTFATKLLRFVPGRLRSPSSTWLFHRYPARDSEHRTACWVPVSTSVARLRVWRLCCLDWCAPVNIARHTGSWRCGYYCPHGRSIGTRHATVNTARRSGCQLSTLAAHLCA